MKLPFLVAITGRSGSGKSTVSAFYRAKGYPVLDADAVAREIVDVGSPVLNELCACFGEDILCADGTLNRKKLAEKAFCNPQQTKRLSDITHPAIVKRLLERASACAEQGAKVCFVDGAVILGSPLEPYCERWIVVTAPYEQAVQRIMQRDGISAQRAKERLRVQTSEETLLARADYHIRNDGDQAALNAQAQTVLALLLKTVQEAEMFEQI